MHPADTQPAPGSGQDAALDKFAAELHVRGYQAHLIAPDGRPPSLAVTNPQATALAETVMADATSFWWPICRLPVDRQEESARRAAVDERDLRRRGGTDRRG